MNKKKAPYAKPLTAKESRSVYEQPDVVASQVSFRELYDLEAKIQDCKDNSERQELKKLAEKHKFDWDRLEIHQTDVLIQNIEREMKLVDREILESDDDDRDILDYMKSIHEKLLIKDAELKQMSVNNFLDQAKKQRHMASRKKDTMVFSIARKDAEKTAMSILTLDNDEIASLFSTEEQFIDPSDGPVTPKKMVVMWSHRIKGRDGNIIPHSPGIKHATRMNDNKQEPFFFTLSSFFRNPQFVRKVNEYYNHLGLELSLTQDKTLKNKWNIKLVVTRGEIMFPQNIEMINNKLELDNIQMVNTFE